jgi:hypothetical protein
MAKRSASLKWCNLSRGLEIGCFLEGFQEFLPVNGRPLNDKTFRSCGQTTFQERKVLYGNFGGVLTVKNMKMGREMIVEVDLNDDSIEA